MKAKKQIKPKKRKRALILSGGGARGAYQVGVWKYLVEMGWKPDLICGTSVGAINATAIASDLKIDELVQLWKTIERGKIYRISLWKQIIHFFTKRGFQPIMDTEPLKRFLVERINIPALRSTKTEIIIAAINIAKSQLKFFSNEIIDIEHIMASSAIPVLFPWQYVDGEPYWDGGVMANTPILPALERQAEEIIVVLLSPIGGTRMTPPVSRWDALERVFEQSLIGSYASFMAHLAWENKISASRSKITGLIRKTYSFGKTKITTIAPNRMLGIYSILNFSAHQADALISEGYTDARNQLAPFFGLDEEPY